MSANDALTSPPQRYAARLRGQPSAIALQARLIAQEQVTFLEAMDHFSHNGCLAEAAALTVSARRRFVVGSGKSFAYANLLAIDLAAGLSHVTLLDGISAQHIDVLTDLRDTDVLIAFSMRRYRRSTVDLAEQFHRRGAAVIGITDSASSPLASFSRVLIKVPTNSASFADSPTAVAAATHLLSALATASAKGARRRLATRDELASQLDLYV